MAAKRKSAIADPRDLGTAKTRKRLRESTLARLIRQGRIDPEMEHAATEIIRIYGALTRRLWARTSSMEKIDRASSPHWCPEWLLEAYLERYIPFTEALSATRSPALAVLYDVLIDDLPLKDIDRNRRVRDGYARQMTISGLKLYADLARRGRIATKEQRTNVG